MRLLTVGDSFTYGEELADLKFAWPFLLGTKLEYSVNNLGKPGTGNTSIVRNTILHAKNFDLIIIAWSQFGRIEMADEVGFYDLWPGCKSSPHTQFAPWRTDLINYITNYHNDEYLYRQYLINIILLQTFLKANNKNYIMLDAFYNNDVRHLFTEKNQTLLDQIDASKFMGWPTESLMKWTYGVRQGPRGHFLEQGHELVADKIYEHIRHLGWIS